MRGLAAEANLLTYRKPEVVSHYAAMDYVTPCEKWLIETYVKPETDILDLGVGGGRTTPQLSKLAGRYVGVDYSREMVDICRRKFPGMEFVEASATSLPMLTDASFDCVFFAFNGIDYIVPRKQREACLLECRRVLRKGGLLIFSSHNPRAVVERLSWNAERAGQFTSDLADQTGISTTLMLPLVMGARIATACISAVCGTLRRIGRRLPTKAFWSGEGYLFDPAHGGLQTHYCIPECAISELEGLGFRHLGTKGDDYPRPSHRYITDWYYYVFAKCE